MKTILINEMIPPEINYYTSKEITEQKHENFLFGFVAVVCAGLNLDIPNIALGNIMLSLNPDTGELSERLATTWSPNDCPALDKPLIYLGLIYPNGRPLNIDVILSGVVSHEIRHIWQQKYHADDYRETAKGFTDSLYNPSEIDADAFAIVCVSRGVDMEKIGQHICKSEYERYPDAFALRIDRAKKILSDMQHNSKAAQKKPLLKRFRALFIKKKQIKKEENL